MKRRILLLGLSTLWSAAVVLASAQTFQNVQVEGAVPLAQVAAGGASVWAIDTKGFPYLYQGQFNVVSNILLTQIAVGGGNSFQADEVWALDSLDRIYIGSSGEMGWNFTQVQGALSQIAVGAGYSSCHPYEVWGISSSSQIFRFDFCAGHFEQVPGLLKQLSVGGGDVWGVSKSNQIFHYNPQTNRFKQVPGLLTQITVGVDGVCGINALGEIYQFDPSTQRFFQLPGRLNQIRAGGNGIWGISPTSQIYRLDPSTQSFVQVSGLLTAISVGTGGGVWGISASNLVYAFITP